MSVSVHSSGTGTLVTGVRQLTAVSWPRAAARIASPGQLSCSPSSSKMPTSRVHGTGAPAEPLPASSAKHPACAASTSCTCTRMAPRGGLFLLGLRNRRNEPVASSMATIGLAPVAMTEACSARSTSPTVREPTESNTAAARKRCEAGAPLSVDPSSVARTAEDGEVERATLRYTLLRSRLLGAWWKMEAKTSGASSVRPATLATVGRMPSTGDVMDRSRVKGRQIRM